MSTATTMTAESIEAASDRKTTSAQVAANRRNARKSTGPKTEDGKRITRANALKHGLTGSGMVLSPALQPLVEAYRRELEEEFGPSPTRQDRMLIEQAAVAMARLERLPQVEEQRRVYLAERAADAWEIDTGLEAFRLGERLERAPRLHAETLKSSFQGCLWMIERWTELLKAKGFEEGWTDDDRAKAANLLGLEGPDRQRDARIAPERSASELETLCSQEIASLWQRIESTLGPLDIRDRELAMQGVTFDISLEARRLRGYEATSFRRMLQAREELRQRRAVRENKEGAEVREACCGDPSPKPPPEKQSHSTEEPSEKEVPDQVVTTERRSNPPEPPVAEGLEKRSHRPEEPLMQMVAAMAAHPRVSEGFRDRMNMITPEQMREWIGVAPPGQAIQALESSELPANDAGSSRGPDAAAPTSSRPPSPLTKAEKRKRRRDEARRRQEERAASRCGSSGSG